MSTVSPACKGPTPGGVPVEIMSPGKENRDRDLLVKRQLYGKYGVKEYWVIDTEERYVLIYQLRGQSLDEVGTIGDDGEITTSILPGFLLKVSAIFNL